MGYPGKCKKKFSAPSHPWQAERIKNEGGMVRTYGLRNKREVWKAESALRKHRREARKLLAESYAVKLTDHTKLEIDNILNSLGAKGILGAEAKLDDILSLNIEALLDRRLQTQVCRQGLARTMKQARQFIVHGHIAVANRKITVPSYIVNKEEESQIGYYVGSPLTSDHPVKP